MRDDCAGKTLATCVCFLCMFGWWCGIFFGLTLYEIRRETEFELATCNTTHTWILPFRYCSVSSGPCASLSSSIESCSSASSRHRAIPEADVSAQTIASLEVTCRGPSCCLQEACETCEECTETCTGSGESRSCSESCRSYECNCRCVSYGEERRQQRCAVHGRLYVTMTVEMFEYDKTPPVTTVYTEEFSSVAAAQAREREAHLRVGQGTWCYVDPEWDRGGTIGRREFAYDFEMGYSVGMWVALFFPSLCIVCVLVGGVQSCCNSVVTAVLQWVAWVGTIIPLAVFLPIAVSRHVESDDQVAMWCVIMAFMAVGWSPMLLVLYHATLSDHIYDSRRLARASLVATCSFVTLPLGVVGPVLLGVTRDRALGGLFAAACVCAYAASLLLFIVPVRELYVRGRMALAACVAEQVSWATEALVRGFEVRARGAPRLSGMPAYAAEDVLMVRTRTQFDVLWNAHGAEGALGALEAAYRLAAHTVSLSGQPSRGLEAAISPVTRGAAVAADLGSVELVKMRKDEEQAVHSSVGSGGGEPEADLDLSGLSASCACRNAGVWKYLRDELRMVGLAVRAEHADWWPQLRPTYVRLMQLYGEQTSTHLLLGMPVMTRTMTRRFIHDA